MTTKKTVLVLDDDQDLADVLADVLEEAGYNVMRCADPIRALADLNTIGKTLSLAIVDMSMPWINGANFVETARLKFPALKFLLLSGASADATSAVAERVGVPFLCKPVEMEDLVSVVDRMVK